MGQSKPIQCPGCAAGLEYSPESAMMQCPYCGSKLDVQQDPEAKRVIEVDYEQAIQAAAEAQVGTLSDKALEVECATCGASVMFEPPEAAGACPFCTTKIAAQPRSADPLIAPQGLLPFSVPRARAVGGFQGWLSSRWFAPNDLKKLAKADRLSGVYLPYWTYDAKTTTEYKGQRGEHYYETEYYTITEKGETVEKSREVRKTKWYPASGVVRNSFDDILVPSTRAVNVKRLNELEPWDLQQVMPFNASYLAGFKAQRYQVDLREGFLAAQERMKPAIHDTIRKDIGGDEQQITSVNAKYSEVSFKHLLLPVWIGAYRFKSKVYQISVNARTGEVCGERPYSAAKITLFVLFVLVVLAILFVAGRS
jgi:DNA-directed RNA polymerase subunit RPC12/RpoP